MATVLWVVVITNAINFIDNMDGLSSGVSTIAAAFFFLASYQSGQWLVALMSVALAGAALMTSPPTNSQPTHTRLTPSHPNITSL